MVDAADEAPAMDSAVRRDVEELAAMHPNETYLLYAMGLRLRSRDYDSFETDELLDGPDDKKIDFFNLDFDTGIATIAQGYFRDAWDERSPPANKASDLNTAMAWLLESDLDRIPRAEIRAAAEQLRDELTSGRINRLDIFFVHNLPGSAQVDGELETAERTTNRLLERFGDGGQPPIGYVRQIDRAEVERWRTSLFEAISIRDEVSLTSVTEPQRLEGPEWRAVSATVRADELVALARQYDNDLYNANVRDYLGSRSTAQNINRQIQKTASEEPANFWIYNNGVTLLTTRLDLDGRTLNLQGVSVINGAQTTGSLLQAFDATGSVGDSLVPIRVIESNDPDVIAAVIRYNNLQNPVKAWDRRVIDPIQTRLQTAFAELRQTYQLRRGLERRRATDIHFDKLGPYLTAFYGDPVAAANKSEVFESEAKYRDAFHDESDPRNLLFIYRVGTAVATVKKRLREMVAQGTADDDRRAQMNYFRYGPFQNQLIYAAAQVLGVWLAGRDPRYTRKITVPDDVLLDLAASERVLVPFIENIVLPAVHAHLRTVSDPYSTVKTEAGGVETAGRAKALIEQVQGMMPETYASLTEQLVLL